MSISWKELPSPLEGKVTHTLKLPGLEVLVIFNHPLFEEQWLVYCHDLGIRLTPIAGCTSKHSAMMAATALVFQRYQEIGEALDLLIQELGAPHAPH